MRIFITGATGYIGSRLAALLNQNGHEVSVLIRKVPKNSDKWLNNFKNIIFGDLLDYNI